MKRNRCNDMPSFSISPLRSSIVFIHTHTHPCATRELLPKTAAVSRSFRSWGLISHKDSYPALLPRAHYLLTHPALRPLRFSIFFPERNAVKKDRGRTVRRLRAVPRGRQRKEPRTVSYVDRGPRADGHVNRLGLDRRSTCGRQAPTLHNPRKRARGERPTGAPISRYWNALFAVASNR